MTVVYLDSVFLLNAGMDYFLLLATARLTGIPLHRGRYLLAALLGGGYAAAVFLPGLGFLALVPVRAVMGLLLALVSFGGEEKLFRLTLLLFAVSCAMAGCVLGLGLLSGGAVPAVNGVFYTDVSVRVLLIASGAAYLVLTVAFRASAHRGVQGRLLPVQVCLQGKTVTLTALHDTGNSLRDPSDGRPVLVVSPGALTALLPPSLAALLTAERLRVPAELLPILREEVPAWKARLLPYRSVGGGGLLLTVSSDWVTINGQRFPGLPVALSPGGLGDGCAALWGGEGKGGELHGCMVWKTPAAADAAGAAARGECALHWRQRYASAAADPGTGGGAAGTFRGGTGAAGADRT